MPELPWDPWMADLGTGTWIANEFGDREVIDVYRFSGHLVLCPLPLHDQLWWITVPHDHFGPEPDIYDEFPEHSNPGGE
ncbi:hypothetical protein JB92DRAFT_1758364 [Gautieria morchelliformis]|nr:hypothetical protein JB92DRAFT_1758364 [Gautieria morchelliformis]